MTRVARPTNRWRESVVSPRRGPCVQSPIPSKHPRRPPVHSTPPSRTPSVHTIAVLAVLLDLAAGCKKTPSPSQGTGSLADSAGTRGRGRHHGGHHGGRNGSTDETDTPDTD